MPRRNNKPHRRPSVGFALATPITDKPERLECGCRVDGRWRCDSHYRFRPAERALTESTTIPGKV